MSLADARLNPSQWEAVRHVVGPLLILAGAGSGKTRVLTHRIAWLLEQGVDPRSILAVTFTNKAAAEMKHRVTALVGDRARQILVTTFHSACVRFLRQDIEALGWPRSFAIYDTDDQSRLLKEILKQERVNSPDWTVARVRHVIDQAKNRMCSPLELAEEHRHEPGSPVARVYARYEEQLKAAGAVDFNDLLNLVVRLWEERPDILARMQRRYRFLMVDEYQDTNRAQYRLIKLLMQRPPGEDRNVAVVGDDDQSIYAFRGADIRNILDFERDFPEAKTVRLEQNYRSTAHILSVAHAVVRHNQGRMDKTLWTELGEGVAVRVRAFPDETEEAQAVVDEIRSLVRRGEARWGECAVIYRTNAASRSFEQALVRAAVPHVLVGAHKFYERREVRDLLAYLKLVLNPADDMAFQRVINEPARGIGAQSLDAIRALGAAEGVPLLEAARRFGQGSGKARSSARAFVQLIERMAELSRVLSPGELVQRISEDSGYAPALRAEGSDEARGRLDNLQQLASAVEEPGPEELELDPGASPLDPDDPLVQLQRFIDRVSLSGQDEDLPEEGDQGKVTLLTAHLAKGLEFPNVFVVGFYEGGFPHFRALERTEDLEEERRLVYVAMTRAQRRLVLTRARRRLVPGSGFQDVKPSRFLSDLPTRGVVYDGTGPTTGFVGGASRKGPPVGPSYRAPAGLERTVDRRATPAALRPPAGPSPAGRASPAAPAPLSLFSPSPAAAPVAAPTLPAGAEDDEACRTVTLEDPAQLRPGVQVLHPLFGRGVVQERLGSPANLQLVIFFQRHGRKKLLLKHTNLEILVP